ncbi:MAG: hypothetical protein RLZZ623_2433 [Actinomycetota bacterium]|jgi:Ferritin-like domain
MNDSHIGSNHITPTSSTHDALLADLIGRRRFLQIGSFTVATAAVLAACGNDASSGSGVGRVGIAPTTTKLPDPVVNDVVLLRTAASLEYSAVAMYNAVIGKPDLLDPSLDKTATRFRDDHAGFAALLDQLTTDAGGKAWGCTNPRVDNVLVAPVLRAIQGGAATDTLPEQPPSDDAKRDVLNFLHGYETVTGAMYQSFMPVLSVPALRQEALNIGTVEVRHAALLALEITGNPEGILPPAEPPADPPKIPVVYAIPSTFGLLGTTQVVLGAADENDARKSFNIDTPSLNTLVYEYMTPSC